MDSYICLNTSDGVVVPTESALLHQFLLFRSGHGFQISGSVQRFVPLCLGGNNTDSVLRFLSAERPVLCHLPFFLRLPGFNASLCLFLSFTSSSVLSIIFLYLYIGGLARMALVAAVEVAAGWAEVYILCGIWC
jgi:hypothetical protein